MSGVPTLMCDACSALAIQEIVLLTNDDMP